MEWLRSGWSWAALAIAGFVSSGCDSAPAPVADPPGEHAHDHGHSHEHGKHDHGHPHKAEALPESYAAAIKEVTDLNEQIKAALAKDNNDAADGPVHKLGTVLEAIEPLAKKADFSAEEQASIKDAVDKLFIEFDKVDVKIHGGEGATYAEVETQVSEAIATLQQFAAEEK